MVYDEDGFEQSARGIHRDTGLDRNGLDSLGYDRLVLSSYFPNRNEQGLYENNEEYGGEYQNFFDEEARNFHHEADQGFYDEVEEDEELHEENETNDHNRDNLEAPKNVFHDIYDEGIRVDGPDEPQHLGGIEHLGYYHDGDTRGNDLEHDEVSITDDATVLGPGEVVPHDQAEPLDMNPGEMADEVASTIGTDTTPLATNPHPLAPATAVDRLLLHLRRRVPIFQSLYGNVYHFYSTRFAFFQEDCCHRFAHRENYYRTSYSQATCFICHFTMRTWFNYYIDCGVVICDWCSESFRGRSEY